MVRSVSRLLGRLRETGTVDRKAGSGRPRSGRTDENVQAVGELTLSQEDASKTQLHSSSDRNDCHTLLDCVSYNS